MFPSGSYTNIRSMTRSEREARNALIVNRMAAGATCSTVASELGVSLSVVSTVALGAGYRSRPGPGRRYDWTAIRSYYEDGHTKRECRERFGFSKGAWSQAVARGDITPRGPDPVKHSHRTRGEVETQLRAGRSQADIARELSLAKSTVAFHARALGLATDRRFARRYDWAEIQAAYSTGMTVHECCQKFGCSRASWAAAVKRGDIVPRPRRVPLSELLSVGKKRNRFHLKARLIGVGLKKNRCERCGLTEWREEAISLELHHVNGDPRDNRLESLQILCPNCHSQTENYGKRNAPRSGATDPSYRTTTRTGETGSAPV